MHLGLVVNKKKSHKNILQMIISRINNYLKRKRQAQRLTGILLFTGIQLLSPKIVHLKVPIDCMRE